GKPVAVRLVPDRDKIQADLNDRSYVKIEIVDEEGNIVPDTDIPVNIEFSGSGAIIASGNAAPDDMESFRSLTPKTFRGRAIAILQPNEKAGELRLSVSAEGLGSANVKIVVIE